MGKVIVGATMSLDGFMNDRSGRVAALFSDLAALRDTRPLRKSLQKTGAVVRGRNTFAMADDPDWYAGNYEYQAPIFVLTHQAPPKRPRQTEALTFTFVTDGIESAVRQAKAIGMLPSLAAPALQGSASQQGSPMSFISMSCRCSWVAAFGYLRALVMIRFSWKGWLYQQAEHISDCGS